MKEGWERMEPPAVLGLRQLAEIIKPAFPGKKLLAAERIGVGLSNANYKIFLDGSTAPYVLRLYRGNATIAGKETAIAQRIRHLVPVADFLYMDWSCSTFSKPWAILEWKEGILLRDVFRSGSGSGIASAAASAGRLFRICSTRLGGRLRLEPVRRYRQYAAVRRGWHGYRAAFYSSLPGGRNGT